MKDIKQQTNESQKKTNKVNTKQNKNSRLRISYEIERHQREKETSKGRQKTENVSAKKTRIRMTANLLSETVQESRVE